MADDDPTPSPSLPEKDAAAYLAGGFLVGGGRFSLLRELARGGMGIVWLAHDERLTTSVALKFLPEAVRANPVALNDLRQETQKSRMLSHPNIIRIYDLYEAPDEAAFISMEYVDGPSLWILQSRQHKHFFSWDYLRPIVKQLCEALDYAHSERVIHRDLKPANMLLDERQRLRLADFGIAARVSGSSADDAGCHRSSGTLAYMSPQQIDGKTASVADDIYALGATLYEMLSGQPPFYQNDIVYQARNVLAPPLSERLADLEVENEVPPAVAAMIMACLSKDPDKRPQSARAVADWIGLADAAAPPLTSFVPVVFTPPETSAPATVTRKTAAAVPAPVRESAAPPPSAENAPRRLFVTMVGAAILGLMAWLAWGGFIPKMLELPTSILVSKTNTADSPGVKTSDAAPAPVPAPIPTPAPSLAPAPAPAPASGEISIGIELGGVNRERGLRQVSGKEFGVTTPATVGGKECRRFEPRKNARCFFQILPAFKHPGPVSARVQVEYYAAAPGALQLRFDGSARQTPHYSGGGRMNFDGKGGWRIFNYQINNALFRGGETGGADFCLTTTSLELYIHSITVFFDQ
jgi:serine/threonine protein kinase